MSSSNYDVVVVGAGAAGVTAAIGLARAGFAVAVVEAADYPGAENWSGCVYFCENLAHPEILGPEGVEALAWERRLVERGFFATDGHGLMGMTYRDPAAFRHCYTVLRPIFDHHLAQVALRLGVALLNATTAESLIREGGRVIGIGTNRGPLYGDLIFLAEGDASHLVTREGYERFPDQREAPKFLQGIKQVIELPPGAIEDTFGVGAEEGVAYEMLVRNGTLRGRKLHLNMGGFIYTNRQSLSIGLVLPANNLAEQFDGDPNLLLEWFENIPVLQRWLKSGIRGAFGAKLIRGGGAKDIPRLIDDGLAIGGAASAIGIDFPYPNFTGPATAMGLLITRTACRIREEKTAFTQDALRRHYLEPLQQTHYWNDVEFLRHWPSYVKRTPVFFDRNLDLALGSVYVWTRPDRWFISKWLSWLHLIGRVAGPGHWQEMRADLRHLSRALRFREIAGRPSLGRFLLDGSVNALRDLFGSPRPHLPEAGTIQLHYHVANEASASGMPRPFRRWFRRFAPVLASAARRVYTNDEQPLSQKLNETVRLLLKQVNVLDLAAGAALGLAAGMSGAFLIGWGRLRKLLGRSRADKPPTRLYPRYASAARRATDLTPALVPAAQNWESRLGQLTYHSVKESHIHVLWPRTLSGKNEVVRDGLWHVCPAHVYEARVSPEGQLQVVVNYENCIKCETCWRTTSLVDWGRDGQHRFIYPVSSPVVERLISAVQAAGLSRPAAPRQVSWWDETARRLAEGLQGNPPRPVNGQEFAEVGELYLLLHKLEQKLQEYDRVLAEEPRTVDRGRAEFLEMLARYAQQLCARVVEILRGGSIADSSLPGVEAVHQEMLRLASAMSAKAEERSRRTWDQRFAWAAADGRQIRQHHLAGLRRFLKLLRRHGSGPALPSDPSRAWLGAEDHATRMADQLHQWVACLDAVFPAGSWRDLERQVPLTAEQDAVLRDLLGQVPPLNASDLAHTLHPPQRKALLAELGRRDPSLAFRAASHLWARDLARLAPASSALGQAAQRWSRGDEWACFGIVEAPPPAGGRWNGEVIFVPALHASHVLLLLGDQLAIVPTAPVKGLTIEPLPSLGLRGAGLARVRLEDLTLPGSVTVDHDRIFRAWSVLSAADLTSIARGMAEQLCQRAIAHATSRVQFPGLFLDEEARDAIGKFGAIKKMIAEMAARRYLIETLEHHLSPADFSSPSVDRAALVKAVAAEALGTAPGSLSYNAGQIFGGTGYSEDDILAKFYRDAAAWRFLGPSAVEVYRRHGEDLLRGWRADGQRLASLANEVELFDQLAQRKALQAELDEVRVVRSRLRSIVTELETLRVSDPAQSPSSSLAQHIKSSHPQLLECLARQDGYLLASKAVLLRTHARLEQGLPAEIETALVRVWLGEVSVAVEEFESTVRRRLDPASAGEGRPVVEPSAGPPVREYSEFLAAPAPYDSGDFLAAPVDLVQPRYVPELIESDPTLSANDHAFRELLTKHFGPPRAEGIAYERYIERQHRPDAADLDFCREHGFFRMPIPRDLGGAGRTKADYYLLTTNAQRFVDVAISLTIQANTSIGTTPVLLARDKDLPKAQKDLGPFVGDTSLQAEVRQRLSELLQLFVHPDPKAIERAFLSLQNRLQETVFGRTVLRVLTHRFGEAWQRAGQAGKAFDLAVMKAQLELALAGWNEACNRAEEYHKELVRRREACDLFLRWVAGGQISAFALTEPSAGSDTARIATRAKLHSVPVETESDGVLRFVPSDGTEPRYLLDAKRLEFRSEGVFYRWSPEAEPASIHFDEYDYETDDPDKQRYYDHGNRRVHFTDIAQLRERDGKLWYDYWELTGAKMWITNGRMSGIMCLYAKTEEGVTGFIVDRHAEGLVVGKDEAKMGQLGSPTNELSLQAVRVPRENVIGLEGRGQVNALETLNVGRAGLAMSAMAQMAGLIEQSKAFARSVYRDIPEWVSWRLQRMEEDRFTAEALAFEVIGRFEHPQTKSVRMESAIAKMLVSELLHRVIEFAEEIHGLAGQTQLHLIEKRKRDARILNIYEGTNEVQRFSILKDLAIEVAPRWGRSVASVSNHLGQEALELEAIKASVRQRVTEALAVFGQEIWQNPNLQANCFVLAEAVAWLKAADSTLGRLAWLSRREAATEEAEPHPRIGLARRSLTRCLTEVQNRLHRFDEELVHLRRGYYVPEIRAASLLFQQGTQPRPPHPVADQMTRPITVLVVVEPNVAAAPQPRVLRGRLLEAHWTLNDADQAALETALRLRDDALAPVSIHVAAHGPRGAGQVLREVLSLGVDRARLLVTDNDCLTPDSAAAALASMCRAAGTFDVILGGETAANDEDGLLARLTAEALEVPFAGVAERVLVRATDAEAEVLLIASDGRQRSRALPAAVLVEAGLPLRSFPTSAYLAGLAKAVEAERWPKRFEARPIVFAEVTGPQRGTESETPPRPLTPSEAAGQVFDAIGLRGSSANSTHAYDGVIEDVVSPALTDVGGLAVLAADRQGNLQASAASALRALGLLKDFQETEPTALVLVPADEEAQRRAVAQVQAMFGGTVVLLVSDLTREKVADSASLAEVKSRWLRECCRTGIALPRLIVGEPWTEFAFAALSEPDGPAEKNGAVTVLRARRLALHEGQVIAETSRAQGKLRARQVLPVTSAKRCWIALTADAEVGAGGPLSPRSVSVTPIQRWSPRLERFYQQGDMQRLLDELKQETGLVRLTDAEFVIDVGFGVGNRDGYETVIQPLADALRQLGVRGLMIGGSRKVTEELHLLPLDRQIGQSGVSVQPRILLAIGISGAPQHMNYINARTTILAFNRDPEAPIMTWNQRQPRPRVFPVVGDLFETVPALIVALRQQQPDKQLASVASAAAR